MALQGDGKIVAVGRAGAGDFALARYNPNGSLDTSFSGDGKQTTDFGGSDAANGVALQGDGKIVAVGRGAAATGDDFALARYNPNGSLDTSFSGDGRADDRLRGRSDDAASGLEWRSRASGERSARVSAGSVHGRGWFRTSDLSRVKRWRSRHGWASLRASDVRGCASMCADVRANGHQNGSGAR